MKPGDKITITVEGEEVHVTAFVKNAGCDVARMRFGGAPVETMNVEQMLVTLGDVIQRESRCEQNL